MGSSSSCDVVRMVGVWKCGVGVCRLMLLRFKDVGCNVGGKMGSGVWGVVWRVWWLIKWYLWWVWCWLVVGGY